MVIDIHPADERAMAEYTAGALPVLERFGGRVVAFDPKPTPLEGDWSPNQVIIVEFADKEAVETFLESAEYRPWKAIRHANSRGRSVAVDGVPA